MNMYRLVKYNKHTDRKAPPQIPESGCLLGGREGNSSGSEYKGILKCIRKVLFL